MREPVVPRLDAETFLMWESRQPERFELHHGFVFAFAGGTLDHDRIAHNLRVVFERLYPAPCRSTGSDFKIRAAADAFYSPDAAVLCDELPGDATSSSSPRVVAVVLSPGTERFDRVEKRAAYRALSSLEAYVLVWTTSRRLEVDLRDAGGTWHTRYVDDDAMPLGLGALALDDVYARTDVA